MIVFTICARNFLAQAITLYESLAQHNRSVMFYVALCDKADAFDAPAYPFRMLSLDMLGIPKLGAMTDAYNITELNTSIKPFVFSYLFDAHPGSAIIYLDPDIFVCGEFEELQAKIDAGADCVLTPHITEPAEFAEMSDRRVLQYGTYNLGFCALRDTPEVRRLVNWWGRRLESECVINLPEGLFVDQKWADFFPAFVEKTSILRHPGYNVAYWNLSQRTVRREGAGWQVNGKPLRFVHFSGSRVEPKVFSRHSEQFTLSNIRDLGRLFDAYCDHVQRRGFSYYSRIAYGFSWHGASGVNEHTPTPGVASGDAVDAAPVRVLPEWPLPYLPLMRARSLDEYADAVDAQAPIIALRRAAEDDLVPQNEDPFEIDGHCVVCGSDSRFQIGSMYARGQYPDSRFMPNWREHLDCVSCGYVNCVRATLHILAQEVSPASNWKVYLTEQVTPLFRWFNERFANVTGSEYLGADVEPGTMRGGIRHEDIQSLSFADACFDLIVSLDVLEHVPEPSRAIRELRRCLKPGGVLLLSAPFRDMQLDHEVRAVIGPDGEIQHRMPPEYHGNPVDPENGALCLTYFGWRLIEDLRSAGFSYAEGLFWWSRDHAYLGATNNLFLARV
jgi:SAM-dependent methyltransferase